MSDAILDRAAGALRARARGEDAAAGQTLVRVLHTVHRDRRRRRLARLVALQLAIASVGLGAWAAHSGAGVAVVRRLVGRAAAPAAASAPRPAPPRARAMPPPPPLEDPPIPLPAVAPPAAAPGPRRRPRPASRAAASAPRESVLPADPLPPEEIYRRAHEAHFVRRDFAAALALWDRYLELGGAAPLGVEARFNRAIALLQLGRRQEAAAALRPFADGDYGSYRQEDARALVHKAAAPPGN